MPDASSVDNTFAKPAFIPTLEQLALKRRFPTALDLRDRARRRLPNFAFEYADGGAGADTGIQRNWAALDAVEMIPRYGKVVAPPPADTRLFGKPYAAPIGIAPIGGPGTTFPGAETYLARAAQLANIPYTLGLLSGIDVEHAAEIAPDVLWLQLYRFSKNDHKIGLDLVRRAKEAGVHVLVLTVDTPTRTTRPREVKSGIMNPFKLTMRLRMDAIRSPHWMHSLRRNGIPRFTSLAPYMDAGLSISESAAFIRRESGGAFTWDEIKLYRDKWQGPLVLKGIMHPDDAERAVELGLDGLFVTNHGGRQIDALPAPIDVLPEISERVGEKTTLIYDSGVRSGVDAARAVALGADAAFAGKSFLWSLGALGEKGPAHLIDVFIDDLSATLGQLGCQNVEELRQIAVRHPRAYSSEDFQPRV
ncbi:MAG: alpha-hydroxy-acid oxidizing enzyme [Pelagibacteraceae bacterium]|nr:alpha-hydroxy-acid oxidizing enzyme [Pelagibacteraceae bacterium]PPR09993.1 MAG: L-lactate dehydrogenase [Alphaproteobacteria bacterium MarineAlpha11_Bin1]